MRPPAAPLYHERQARQLCLKHCLNNLLQRPAFTEAELNSLADSLREPVAGGLAAFLPSHRTLFFGNYDANVLVAALQLHGKTLSWHDARDDQLEQLDLASPRLWAVVANVPSTSWLAPMLGGRHWLGLRRFGSTWWDLDSLNAEPVAVGEDEDAREFLRGLMGKAGGCHVLLIHDSVEDGI